MTHRFVVGHGFQADVDALPQSAKEALVVALRDVLDGVRRGAPLEQRDSTADLSDCRKLYFDPDPHSRPRYRLVYRETEGGVIGVTVTAIAVGRRDGLDAYLRAARNLGR